MKFARTLALAGVAAFVLMGTAAVAQQAPKFEIDTSWPKSLPNNWNLRADRRHLRGQGRQCLDQPAPAHGE